MLATIALVSTNGKPLRAAAYQRISEVLRDGDEHGVRNQLADQRRMAAARGYEIVMSEADNDISAFTGKRRPGYEAVMAAARRGEIDAILVFQTSRFWRDREERGRDIKILKKTGVSIIATKGPSLDMSTAYGRAMAGLLGEFDTMESEVKSERQQLANHHAALGGIARRGCPPPFGWQADRVTADPAEAAAVLAACRALLAGGTIAGVARDWNRRGLRPHQAPFGPLREHPWARTSVREILKNPRIAGISAYRTVEDVHAGKPRAEVARGKWEPLVPEEMWRAVLEILTSPYPRSDWGGTLLGGIGFCRCGNHVTGGRSANGHPSYRCRQDTRNGRPGPHVGVKREDVDRLIGAVVTGRLSAPDAIGLLTPADGAEVAALRDEETGLRARLARLGVLYADGVISEADLISGRERGSARAAEIGARLAGLGRGDVLAPLVTAGDVAAAWEALDLPLKRAVVGTLMTVTLHPSGPGARRFDPGRVLPPGRGIVWKGVQA